jgi:serine/threonine-protein kinase
VDATLQDPLVGRLLDDRYLVLDLVARGGMATVYHAHDRRLDRAVALKVLHTHLAGDAAFAARFDREARAAARLSHANVVAVFDQGQDGDLHYLAMEYLPGRTLRQVLVERGALTAKETYRVMEPVLDALAAAHRAGIVHRDVKPENVILTDDGRVKVADFGLARAATSSNATQGVLLGTVAYLAPELVVSGTADARSDVYSAGIMLFEMLTGRQPFVGEMPAQVAYRHVHEDVPAPSSVAPTVPAALDGVVRAATVRDIDRRPTDAAALLAILRGARRHIPADQLDARAEVPYAPGAFVGGEVPAGRAVRNDPFDGLAATQAVDRAVDNRTQAFPGGQAGAAAAAAPTAYYEPAAMPPSQGRFVQALPVNEDAPVRPVDDATYARIAAARRRRGYAVMAMVLVAAVVLVLGSYWFIAGPGAKVVVPVTATLTRTEATKKLAEVSLKTRVQNDFSDTVKAGLVISSDPAAGESARKDGTVLLLVSKGPQLFAVPDVTGQSESQASDILDGEGFRLGKVVEKFSNEVDEGLVVSQSPAGDAKKAKGTAVDVVVSKGPEPVDVPNVVGKTQDEAENILGQAGFSVTVDENQVFDATVPAGSVVSQTPASGQAERGSQVTLVISKGPDASQLVSVPFVVGRDEESARKRLEEAGLGVDVQRNGNGFDRVFQQNPSPGTQVPVGTVVTIVFF